jgi:UDP-N-acetylmuramoylalanine--D-glutamate ligase
MNNTISKDFFKKYENHLVVIGKGISGNSVQKFLKTPIYNTDELDFMEQQLINKPIKYIYISPGINLNIHSNLTSIIQKNNWEIVSDFDLLYEYNPHGIYIGITGSAGKTTTIYMLKFLFDKLNITDYNFVGNQGIGVFDHNPNAKYHIMEISSFQLEHINHLRLDIGLITNIIPTHLNRHKEFSIYQDLKLKILKKDPNKNQLFYAKSIEESLKLIPKLNYYNSFEENSIWAISIMHALGFNVPASYLNDFELLKYRQQIVFNNENILIINDSKSTTDISVQHAIETFKLQPKRPFYLIIGNRPKSHILTNELIENLKYIDELWIFGNHCDEWMKMFQIYVKNIQIFHNIHEFPLIQSGILLFSPLGESFDQFKSYEERGNIFNEYVKNYI